MKIVTILGARPQFIKAGTISREIERCRELGHALDEVIVHTGQHYDANMSGVFFDELQIPRPDHHLGIGGMSHGEMTGQMIGRIAEVLSAERPEWVLVYGDTNSTLAGAIAASKMLIPIAHVEAGLRSFNMSMPEEVNRILTDRISSLLFCPTPNAVVNLRKEGFGNWKSGARLLLSGDVMLDGATFYKQLAKRPLDLHVDEHEFVLCTLHRAENTDDPKRLSGIVNALKEIARHRAVVLPLHPRTRKAICDARLDLAPIVAIEPIGYLSMIWLLDNCRLVVTDSGGLQKEAFFFRKPCLTLRDETEWVELVDYRFNVLAGADPDHILQSYFGFQFALNWEALDYGGGKASERIVGALITSSGAT